MITKWPNPASISVRSLVMKSLPYPSLSFCLQHVRRKHMAVRSHRAGKAEASAVLHVSDYQKCVKTVRI